MTTIRLTRKFTFEMAHALPGYDGKCRHIHGHSYILYVTVKGVPEADPAHPKYGMVMDFTELKSIVQQLVIDRLDHALLLRRDAPLAAELTAAYEKVVTVPYQPTCENMVIDFAEILQAALPDKASLHSIRLHETATSYAEWVNGER
ncbi:MAG: 6-carboxytetrahydropterin synthase [Prevotellaceae bacterium]|jgi:6-pyruvoyltetrahydropterin/6-carboxytetrahydropterin synthase|nr:6-carboxytetrahydropterin synthase [Prevotellaceae bacterium]